MSRFSAILLRLTSSDDQYGDEIVRPITSGDIKEFGSKSLGIYVFMEIFSFRIYERVLVNFKTSRVNLIIFSPKNPPKSSETFYK